MENQGEKMDRLKMRRTEEGRRAEKRHIPVAGPTIKAKPKAAPSTPKPLDLSFSFVISNV